MTSIFFSPSLNSFFPVSLKKRYEEAGKWPSDAIKSTEEDFLKYGLSNPPDGKARGVDDKGKPVWVELEDATIGQLSQQALKRVNDGYVKAMASILVEYPDAETLSFDKQEREARTWSEWQEAGGHEPETPYLDAMLVERPIGKAELVGRIITKADAFVAAHGNATGRRQRLEDDIKAARQAEDRAALEAIDW